jgi:hypothetical protein
VRLGFCLSTILVAGALTVSGSLAEEAVPAARVTASPPASAGGQKGLPNGGATSGARGSTLEGGAGSAGTADTPGAKGKAGGSSPIDTRITVQPIRAVKKPLLGSEKINPTAPPSVSSTRPIIPHEMSSPARNAIGIPQDHGAAATNGAAKNPVGALGGNNGRGGGGADIVRPSPIPAIAGAAPHNRAVITGTGMSRPGSGPATLGGAAKNVAAINGTNIRRKQ